MKILLLLFLSGDSQSFIKALTRTTTKNLVSLFNKNVPNLCDHGNIFEEQLLSADTLGITALYCLHKLYISDQKHYDSVENKFFNKTTVPQIIYVNNCSPQHA